MIPAECSTLAFFWNIYGSLKKEGNFVTKYIYVLKEQIVYFI
jgi:hypothetical protein